MRRLTFGGKSRYPVWSPDGLRIAFQSDREGDLAIFSQRTDGTGAAERLTRPEDGRRAHSRVVVGRREAPAVRIAQRHRIRTVADGRFLGVVAAGLPTAQTATVTTQQLEVVLCWNQELTQRVPTR
jgi:hypothetical protein